MEASQHVSQLSWAFGSRTIDIYLVVKSQVFNFILKWENVVYSSESTDYPREEATEVS